MMESNEKWKGRVSARLQKATADHIWPLFLDFFGLNKWFPGLAVCHGVHGTNGEPGCVRYCAGFSLPSESGDGATTSWSKEILTAVDPVNRSLRYAIVDSNIGFESYSSTVKIVPDNNGGGGCAIEWWFEVDPVEGWRLEDLVKKYESGLQLMAKKMEDSFEVSEL
ncbi:unnamed protein product [Cuscuta campestris]|uniref:Bet v I/Major latex protein domain-containing protein n=1 Tax=Cuscuta campestris TaxID=132261 RepID=A0A484KC29_9ASTE|nr:unnamed protein product [Cuscuta campestris]